MRVVVKRSIKKCLLWGWSLGTPDLGASQLSLKSETCSKEFTKEMLSLGLGSWSPRSGREPAKLLGMEDYCFFGVLSLGRPSIWPLASLFGHFGELRSFTLTHDPHDFVVE